MAQKSKLRTRVLKTGDNKPTFEADDPRLILRVRESMTWKIANYVQEISSFYNQPREAAKLLQDYIGDIERLNTGQLGAKLDLLRDIYEEQKVLYQKRLDHESPQTLGGLEILFGPERYDPMTLAPFLKTLEDNGGKWNKRKPSLEDYDHDRFTIFGDKSY